MFNQKKALVLAAILVLAAVLSIPASLSPATAQTQQQQAPRQQMYAWDLITNNA